MPLAEIYSSISETLSVASVGRTEILRTEVAPVVGGVGEAEFAVLPDTAIGTGGRVLSEMAPSLRFQMRSLESISVDRRNGWGPDGSLIRDFYLFGFMCIRCTSCGQSPTVSPSTATNELFFFCSVIRSGQLFPNQQ